MIDIREMIIEEEFFEARGIPSRENKKSSKIEGKKTYLVLDDRTYFGKDEYGDDEVLSTMGDYEILIPIETILNIKEDKKAMLIINKMLGGDMRSVLIEEDHIRLSCNIGELAHINNIECIYYYKNSLEKKVRKAMEKVNITNFIVEIRITTLY